MTRENYSNILHMYESVKKKQEKPTKKLKSILKRPGETFMIGPKKKLENKENNLRISSDNNLACSKNVEFEYGRERKIPVPPPIPLQYIPSVIEEQNEGLDNSFLGEDDHDFIKNLDSLRMKNKTDNNIEICEAQQHQFTASGPNTDTSKSNKINNGFIGKSKNEKKEVLSAQSEVSLNIVKQPDNKVSTQNNELIESDNEEKINQRKYHQFSFYSREPIITNNFGKKSIDNTSSSISNINEKNTFNKKGELEMIRENEDAIASTTQNHSIKIEHCVTNSIEMSFPAVKPNKNYIISIAKGNVESEHRTSNIKSHNCNNEIDYGDNDLTEGLQFKLKKKEHQGSNNYGRNSNSKQKIDRFLTSNDVKSISTNNNENNEFSSASKGIKSSLHKDHYFESKAHLKTNTIETIPESPKARNAKFDDYHDYVVVHKQNKYGNKNIDLARKSQIHDAKEILYNQ
jgi:hypothetical protein